MEATCEGTKAGVGGWMSYSSKWLQTRPGLHTEVTEVRVIALEIKMEMFLKLNPEIIKRNPLHIEINCIFLFKRLSSQTEENP